MTGLLLRATMQTQTNRRSGGIEAVNLSDPVEARPKKPDAFNHTR